VKADPHFYCFLHDCGLIRIKRLRIRLETLLLKPALWLHFCLFKPARYCSSKHRGLPPGAIASIELLDMRQHIPAQVIDNQGQYVIKTR
jgi:hypothetical protein